MIDLHTHTTASDGTFSPAELVDAAVAARLEAVAITDHDTFEGFDEAAPYAREKGLRLVCGIELSTKLLTPVRRTVLLLGYFLNSGPRPELLSWILNLQAARRDRNQRLALKLQSMGIDVRLEEVEALGRRMAGRPHFARLLVAKGYCSTTTEAFDRYLDESAPGYVDREEPGIGEAIARIREGGGISSLAHPIRLGKRDAAEEEHVISAMRDLGLQAIEVFHSDHMQTDMARYLAIARKFGLKVTGGSDFHGENKPSIEIGRGAGNLAIPVSLLDELAQ
ncbi:MAG TPA: PHP domain-containing protein [Bryobacteraceae bacterium]|nr:PHP domain-containing protein [Bryobacteraceae bacterium]